jgi:uncharacterized integral membrane protein
MGMIRGVVLLLFVLLGIGFAMLNDQPISLKYYFGWISPPLPLFLWAFLFLLFGLILSAIWAFFSKLGLNTRIRQRKRTLAELEARRDRLQEQKIKRFTAEDAEKR